MSHQHDDGAYRKPFKDLYISRETAERLTQISTQTPKTPYELMIDIEQSKPRNERNILFLNALYDAQAGYRLATSTHAADHAALQGVRGPKCETCNGSGMYEPKSGMRVGARPCPDCIGPDPRRKGSGHMPLAAGSVADLVRAAQAAYTMLRSEAHDQRLQLPITSGLGAALAAFTLDEEQV